MRWCAGSNLFSSWLYETKTEQQREQKAIGFDIFTDVEPFHPKIEGVVREGEDETKCGHLKDHWVVCTKARTPRGRRK